MLQAESFPVLFSMLVLAKVPQRGSMCACVSVSSPFSGSVRASVPVYVCKACLTFPTHATHCMPSHSTPPFVAPPLSLTHKHTHTLSLRPLTCTERTLAHLIGVYAAAIAALHSIIDDNKVSGQFLQATVDRFHELYSKQQSKLQRALATNKDAAAVMAEAEATMDKRPLNMASLLALLYHFGVVTPAFIFDLLRMFIDGEHVTPLDVELVLEVLRTCGAKLRQDDNDGLADVFRRIRAAAAQSVIGASSRVRFMLDSVQDLQAKKGRIMKDNREQLRPLVRVRSVCCLLHAACCMLCLCCACVVIVSCLCCVVLVNAHLPMVVVPIHQAVTACRRAHDVSARAPLNISVKDLLDAENRGLCLLHVCMCVCVCVCVEG